MLPIKILLSGTSVGRLAMLSTWSNRGFVEVLRNNPFRLDCNRSGKEAILEVQWIFVLLTISLN